MSARVNVRRRTRLPWTRTRGTAGEPTNGEPTNGTPRLTGDSFPPSGVQDTAWHPRRRSVNSITHSQPEPDTLNEKRRREEPGFRPVRPRHLERTTTDRPERRLMERDLELHRREAKGLLVVSDRDHPVGEIHVIDGSRRVTGERERQEEGSGEPDLIVIAVAVRVQRPDHGAVWNLAED